MPQKSILIYSKDSFVCQSVRKYFQDSSTNVECVTSAVEALSHFFLQKYCLVIADYSSDEIYNSEIISAMRKAKHVPIIVVTAHLNPTEKVELFHAGADSCIEKPVEIEVLAAQAEALIQLYVDTDIDSNRCDMVTVGTELIICPRYRQVIVDGKSLTLTRKEFDLLYCLASYPGQVFSRKQLYDHVWQNDFGLSVDETVKAHIKTLRKKLSSVGKNYIQNIWGVGYKFSISNA